MIDKIEEELGELRAELAAGTVDQARLTDELGDVLFAVANLARHCKVDPEAALRATNDKFERRFRHIEKRLAEAGRKPADATLEEMEALWQEAKTRPKRLPAGRAVQPADFGSPASSGMRTASNSVRTSASVCGWMARDQAAVDRLGRHIGLAVEALRLAARLRAPSARRRRGPTAWSCGRD